MGRSRRGLGATFDRLRGLRHIRTLGDVRRSAGLGRPTALGAGHLAIGSVARRPQAPAPDTRQPRAWVFINRPRFARHQGMLSVDRLAEPEVDVFEEERSLVVLAELPGARLEDIDVRVHHDVLTLSTQRRREQRPHYYREILLPFAVATGNIPKTFRNGVLELELERACDEGESEHEQRRERSLGRHRPGGRR